MTEESFAERLRRKPLAGLRTLRRALREEEREVSYWRCLVQGRLDLARAVLAGDRPNAERLACSQALRERAAARRSPAFAKLADGRIDHGLASLAGLWDTPVPWDDREELRRVEGNLMAIEVQLSSYRRHLHQRIDACTSELVGRYRRDPTELRGLGQLLR